MNNGHINDVCICNKTQAVVLATLMGVHVIEIVHTGSLMIDLSFIHDMIHSHVPFVLGKKLGGRAGDYYGIVYIEIVRIGYLIIDMGWLRSVGSLKL